jgi:hypothetical protein
MVYKRLPVNRRDPRKSAIGPYLAAFTGMRIIRLIGRLFVIKNRWEALAVIYALGLGAADRGMRYLDAYPGTGGWLMFAACTAAVFMAGARLLEFTRKDNGRKRRKSDFLPQAGQVLSEIAAPRLPN